MNFFRPYTTLGVGILLGMLVLPKVLRKANINLPM